MFGESACYKFPKSRRVIEFLEMTKLVHHDVVDHMRWEEENPVAKVQISLLRAASPPRFVVLYENFPYGKTVKGVPVCDALVYERPGVLFVFTVVRPRAPRYHRDIVSRTT